MLPLFLSRHGGRALAGSRRSGRRATADTSRSVRRPFRRARTGDRPCPGGWAARRHGGSCHTARRSAEHAKADPSFADHARPSRRSGTTHGGRSSVRYCARSVDPAREGALSAASSNDQDCCADRLAPPYRSVTGWTGSRFLLRSVPTVTTWGSSQRAGAALRRRPSCECLRDLVGLSLQPSPFC